MKNFFCSCGEKIFFDNVKCIACGASVGFDPKAMTMVNVAERSPLKYCDNCNHDACNWVLATDSTNSFCWACQFNRTIPNLALPNNPRRFAALERAKKRLLYTVQAEGLPLENRWINPARGLLFDFLDDARGQADTYPGHFIATGYSDGVITINAVEADEVLRKEAEVALGERYRTLLGHFRHEYAHYVWTLLPDRVRSSDQFLTLFGNHTTDYSLAIENYYDGGPPSNWESSFISAYASAHPLEDWAETLGHYLLIIDAIETAFASGLVDSDPATWTLDKKLDHWAELAIQLNNMSQSIGREIFYPFSISPRVRKKIDFVQAAIRSTSLAH